MASLLPSHGSDACSPTASGYECASGTTDDSTGPGPSTATEDSARRSARPRPDSGISGTPSPAAAPAATVVHDGVARLFDDNLGYRWWDHRQQTTAQERAYANKLLHNYPSIKSDAPHERRARNQTLYPSSGREWPSVVEVNRIACLCYRQRTDCYFLGSPRAVSEALRQTCWRAARTGVRRTRTQPQAHPLRNRPIG